MVRAYSFEDFEALVEMYKRFEPKRVAQGLPPTDVPRIAHWLDHLQNNSATLLAFDGEKIVAHAVLCPIGKNQVEFTIFVLQDYREDGLGTLLSKLTLGWAFGMGFTSVFLTTELSNYRALGLFRKLGFGIKSSFGDECEMVLDLAADSEAQAA
jgi:RimJ/RimL family protein N-acetyltransferase